MIKKVEDLKEFILWCKEQKIGAIKINDIEINFTNLAFIEDVSSFNEDMDLDGSTINEGLKKSELKLNGDEVDDETLFWSS